MSLDEKKVYIIKLLAGIGLLQEKVDFVARELDTKTDGELDEIITKLESYYTKQNMLGKEFIRILDKMSQQIDESVESTIEKFQVEQLIKF